MPERAGGGLSHGINTPEKKPSANTTPNSAVFSKTSLIGRLTNEFKPDKNDGAEPFLDESNVSSETETGSTERVG
jgi:hypothetical protein